MGGFGGSPGAAREPLVTDPVSPAPSFFWGSTPLGLRRRRRRQTQRSASPTSRACGSASGPDGWSFPDSMFDVPRETPGWCVMAARSHRSVRSGLRSGSGLRWGGPRASSEVGVVSAAPPKPPHLGGWARILSRGELYFTHHLVVVLPLVSKGCVVFGFWCGSALRRGAVRLRLSFVALFRPVSWLPGQAGSDPVEGGVEEGWEVSASSSLVDVPCWEADAGFEVGEGEAALRCPELEPGLEELAERLVRGHVLGGPGGPGRGVVVCALGPGLAPEGESAVLALSVDPAARLRSPQRRWRLHAPPSLRFACKDAIPLSGRRSARAMNAAATIRGTTPFPRARSRSSRAARP